MLNYDLLRHPLNWFTIGTMLVLTCMTLHYAHRAIIAQSKGQS
jgi:hypothetical protein